MFPSTENMRGISCLWNAGTILPDYTLAKYRTKEIVTDTDVKTLKLIMTAEYSVGGKCFKRILRSSRIAVIHWRLGRLVMAYINTKNITFIFSPFWLNTLVQ